MPPRLYLDVDTRRLKYRYQPQNDPVLAAQRAAFKADADTVEVTKTCETESTTIGNEERLRGIPVEGFGGVVRGTRPGDNPKHLDDPPPRNVRRRLIP